MLSNTAKDRPDYPALFLAISILIAGCTTSPTSGRTQFNILPAPLESSVSDLRFGVKTMLGAGDYCRDMEGPCVVREEAEKLASRIAPIAERLGAVAPQLSPELVMRVPRVEVFVVPSESASVSSSGGGKIAVNSGLGRLDLSDTELALALAREFGRLAAAHHRESTSAGLAVSLVAGSPLVGAYLATSILADFLFPMGSLIKLGISVLGSIGTEQLVEASQQEEADEFAGKLMLAAGYDLRELAEARPDSPDSTARIGWLPDYFTSRARVAGMVPPAETTAKTGSDQEHTPEIEDEVKVPPPETLAKAVTSQETLSEVKPEVVAPPPEALANAVVGQDPPLEVKAEIAAPNPEMVAKAVTRQEPLSEDKLEIVAPPPERVAMAVARQEPAPMAREVAAEPPQPSAETLKPQDDPPEAKPAAAKKAKKTAVKKGKKPRKPSKKTTRR
jgi:Zn-dependent protease with chaperone function